MPSEELLSETHGSASAGSDPPQAPSAHQAGLDRRGEGVCLLVGLAAAGGACALGAAAASLHSALTAACAGHFALSALLCFLLYLPFRTYRVQAELKRKEELLRSRVGAESLFAQLAPVDPYGRLVRALTLTEAAWDCLCLVVSLALCLHFARQEPSEWLSPATGSALCAFVAFCAYVGGTYIAALSDAPQWRILKPAGAFLISGGEAAFAGLLAFLCVHVGFSAPARVLDRLSVFYFALLSAEKVLALLGRMYGIRAAEALPGRSRVVSLLAWPAQALHSLNEALEYNFGVRVSREVAGRFLRGVVVPLLGTALLGAFLLSCLVWIEPPEVGVCRRLGTLQPELLGPGLHLKAPWPIESVHVVPVRTAQIIAIGGHRGREPVLWTEEHEGEELFLTPPYREGATGVTSVALSASLTYVVKDPAVVLYRLAHAPSVIENLFREALLTLCVRTPLEDFFSSRRKELCGELEAALKKECAPFGVSVLNVALRHVHVPHEAAGGVETLSRVRFESAAVRAQAAVEKRTRTESASFAAARETLRAQSEALLSLSERTERSLLARALTPLWKDAGRLMRVRLLCELLRRFCADRRKLVVPEREGGRMVYEVKEGAVLPILGK